MPQNEITLTSVPNVPLVPGMTVSAATGIRPGTTILSVANSMGAPIPSASAIGDQIYLSLLPYSAPPNGPLPQSQQYMFGKPPAIPYTAQAKPYALTFNTDAQQDKAEQFAGSVYEVMAAEAQVLQPSALPQSSAVVAQVIQFYANLLTDPLPGGKNLTGQVRDLVKSVLRGVWNFTAVPKQSQWYPNPTFTSDGGGQGFNVYNLDPFVWFVHTVEDTAGYAFSVDDDVSNPSAPGPILAPSSTPQNPVYNHAPDNLQIGFGGNTNFGNPNEWFPTLRWGEIDTTATITKVGGNGPYRNDDMVTFTGDLKPKDYLTLFNKIFPPGPGELGAYVSAPGYITPGTTVLYLGPNGLDQPQIVLSQLAEQTTDTPIPIKITGTEPLLGRKAKRR
jgi:hypothetical protein